MFKPLRRHLPGIDLLLRGRARWSTMPTATASAEGVAMAHPQLFALLELRMRRFSNMVRIKSDATASSRSIR
jgi:hypothetical protein